MSKCAQADIRQDTSFKPVKTLCYLDFVVWLIEVDIVPVPAMNVNGYFTDTSPSFTGLSNTPVVSRRARVGMCPVCPEHSTLGHASSRLPRAFNFRR